MVLFGDSITQHGFEDGGWAASVADFFSRRADVFNRGFGGCAWGIGSNRSRSGDVIPC